MTTNKKVYWKLIAGSILLLFTICLIWLLLVYIAKVQIFLALILACAIVGLGAVCCDRDTGEPNIIYIIATGYLLGHFAGVAWGFLREGWYGITIVKHDKLKFVAKKIKAKNNKELLDMFANPSAWSAETLSVARNEIQRRNLQLPPEKK